MDVDMAVGQWSGKQSLPVDRGSDSTHSRTLMESRSSASERVERTRFVPAHNPATQGIRTSWSGATTGVDRSGRITVNAFTPRVGESWSNVREREDRTSSAVDIRDRESGTEPWSDPRERVDRTRREGAVSNSSLTWTT